MVTIRLQGLGSMITIAVCMVTIQPQGLGSMHGNHSAPGFRKHAW